MQDLNIAIVGAGLGGLTAAAALHMRGYKTQVYEQAPELGEIGAGLSLPPNSTRVLEHLGLGDALAEFGNIPDRTIVKHFKSGEVLLTRPGNVTWKNTDAIIILRIGQTFMICS